MPEAPSVSGTVFYGRKKLYLWALLTALAAFAVYLPSLQNGFVNWDDVVYVYENPHIKRIDLNFLRWAGSITVVGNWHPLTMLSLALDYSVWGLNPFGYHLTNIILHALNTALVSLFTLSLTLSRASEGASAASRYGAISAGLFAALLFGLHPLHVESVAWVSERKDVLSAFFFILSALSYVRFARANSGKALYYAFSLILFILALLSKPMAVTLPFVLLILDFYPLERLDMKRLKGALLEKIPFFALSVATAIIALRAQGEWGAIKSHPFSMRLFLSIKGFSFYLYKTFLPINLSPVYPPRAEHSLLSPEFAGYSALFLTITIFCLLMVRRKKVFLAVWLYYIVTLAPVIGIVPVGGQAAADRYMYLPGLGIFILAGLGLRCLHERTGAGHPWGAHAKRGSGWVGGAAATSIIAAIILAAFSLMTVRQIPVWKDSITLWSRVIEQYPGVVITAYNSRAFAHAEAGDYAKAVEDYTTAIGIAPDYIKAYNNRGVAYEKLGDYAKAAEDFNTAIARDPKNPTAYNNLGRLYSLTGEYDKALFYLKKAEGLGIKGGVE
ncbi:MAG: tetratricopeptide repeat protein [Deltaproteobacteria bacterium]|nr:tetratricopeptide repeat protein [Deltaproteobacteria bacterium]